MAAPDKITQKYTPGPVRQPIQKAAPVFKPDLVFESKKPVKKEPEIQVSSKDDVVRVTGLNKGFIDSLINFEGLELEQYKDKAGYRTIGVGHNIDADPKYKFGKTITEEQAYKMLAEDLIRAKTDLKNCIGDTKLTTGQHEALIDLTFNVGITKLKDTKLIQDVKAQKFNDATAQFDFICSGGEVDPGLCKRRIDNIDRFCSNTGHSKESLKSMKQIVSKGIKSYDKKIKKANVLTSFYYQYKKNRFKASTKETLQNAKKSLKTEKK